MPRPPHPPRLAVYAGCLCALAAAAAAVSFSRGGRVGIVWVLLAGLASNMAWYYARRGRGAAGNRNGTRAAAGPRGAGAARGAAAAGCGSGGACGACVRDVGGAPSATAGDRRATPATGQGRTGS
ncbi:hypothetical protein ACFY30_28335 [Streptomyces sp. NPDC000345]|uniref:hypothetical protein n=1 Tax=Streptomyces sp. NPDC000345 TaxID=3364537 RepID=UPI00369453C4